MWFALPRQISRDEESGGWLNEPPVASNVYKIADSYLECEQIDADVQRQPILNPVNEVLRDL